MIKKVVLILCLIVPFIACKEETQRPEVVLSEEKMVEVITEFQLAEAIVRLGYHRTTDSIIFNDSVYAAVFNKLDIPKSRFDTSYNYYSMHPKEFKDIYAKVITNLSTRAAELKSAEKKEVKPKK